MSIIFFCIGGALAISSCYALETFYENIELKKKLEEKEKVKE